MENFDYFYIIQWVFWYFSLNILYYDKLKEKYRKKRIFYLFIIQPLFYIDIHEN